MGGALGRNRESREGPTKKKTEEKKGRERKKKKTDREGSRAEEGIPTGAFLGPPSMQPSNFQRGYRVGGGRASGGAIIIASPGMVDRVSPCWLRRFPWLFWRKWRDGGMMGSGLDCSLSRALHLFPSACGPRTTTTEAFSPPSSSSPPPPPPPPRDCWLSTAQT